jgi:hypothetical protein
MKLNKILSLLEATTNSRYDTSHEMGEIVRILKTRCSDALWMLDENNPNPIWRSMSHLPGGKEWGIVDPSRTSRTGGYPHTLLFPEHSDWMKLPPRESSLIGGSTSEIAEQYGNGAEYAVIPYNNVRIGVVGQQDLFDIVVDVDIRDGTTTLLGYICQFMEGLVHGHTSETFQDFVQDVSSDEFQTALQDAATDTQAVDRAIAKHILAATTPLEGIMSLYDFNRLDPVPKVHTSKNLRTAPGWLDGTEVWVNGPCVLIHPNAFDEIAEKLAEI